MFGAKKRKEIAICIMKVAALENILNHCGVWWKYQARGVGIHYKQIHTRSMCENMIRDPRAKLSAPEGGGKD